MRLKTKEGEFKQSETEELKKIEKHWQDQIDILLTKINNIEK